MQEFIGYCLIPSNKGQRMMVIKGNGGEGKSQIGVVLGSIFGANMKDGSIGKISENRFARADLEHILLCVDDDMRMEALRQTNYVKSIVTAQGKMDLERKGKQSYQGWMFVLLLAFSNGDLQALYDRSNGFYRRQLVLTTKEKPVDRADDPDLAEKMKAEAKGIFLWAFEGLQRLVANNFKFSESDRIRTDREAVKRDNNNIFDFMDSEGYIRRKADASISSKDFYAVYRLWCEENSLSPLKSRSFSDAMVANAKKFNLEHCNNITNSAGRRVWGFMGVEAVARTNINGFYGDLPCTYRRSGRIDFCRFCSVRMYVAFERETLLSRNSSLSVVGIGCGFYVHGILQKLRGQAAKDTVFATAVCVGCSAEQLHADGLAMGKGADTFAVVSRGHRSDRTSPPEKPSESPRHFAASMDESVIVGYYTLKKCIL